MSMGRFVVLVLSSFFCSAVGSNLMENSSNASRRFGPDNLEWGNQLVDSKLFINVGGTRSKGFDMGFDTPIKVPSDCKLPTGQIGKCRSLKHCPKTHFLKSFRTFMLFHCTVGESIGVCCDDPMPSASRRPTSVPTKPVNGPKPTPKPMTSVSAPPSQAPMNPGPKPTPKPMTSVSALPSQAPMNPRPKPTPRPMTSVSAPPSQPSIKPAKTTHSPSKESPVATRAPLKPAHPVVNRPESQKVPITVPRNITSVNIIILLPNSNSNVRVNVTKGSP